MSSDPLGLAAGVNTYGYVSGNGLGFSDRLGLKPVTAVNCIAFMKLLEYEKNNPDFIFGMSSKYNMLNFFEEDTLNLNASFDSIGGKVDMDWMLRSSLMPSLYYIGKPTWNIINNIGGIKDLKFNFTPLAGMKEEGHMNATGAAAFYLKNRPSGMTIRKMFKPAIANCECMLKK